MAIPGVTFHVTPSTDLSNDRPLELNTVHEREIRTFVTVADGGRMDRAARLLGYSQPAITYQIKCLEQDLGVKLFERDGNGVRLSAVGEQALPAARQVLSAMAAMKQASARCAVGTSRAADAHRDDAKRSGHSAESADI